MDKICLKIKCSKKSLYKCFSSKNAMLMEVFDFYNTQVKSIFVNISKLINDPKHKLILQIKALDKHSQIFFESSLFNELKKLNEFNLILQKTEQSIYLKSFVSIINEMQIGKKEKTEIHTILIFIATSITQRYVLQHRRHKFTNQQFLNMLIVLLESYLLCKTKQV